MTGVPALPVLWICGPPGAGKSVVAWEVFTGLAGRGVRTAHVDIDQVGMCYPEPASDPGRHRLKARCLAATIPGYRSAGAGCLVVSGVIDAVRGPGAIPGADLTLCRLRCDDAELTRRLRDRGTSPDLVPAALADARAMERSEAVHASVDTRGLSVAGVAARVDEVTGGWPGPGPTAGAPARPSPPAVATRAGGSILWVCGARAAGKSTIGFRVYERVRRAGLTAGFVDLEQVGFLRPAPAGEAGRHRLRAQNMAAVWERFRSAGADRLVVVGPIERPELAGLYAEAVPAATLTLCRLDTGAAELARRIAIRGQGGGPGIAGDDLRGLGLRDLQVATDRAVAEAERLRRSGVGNVSVATDGLSVEEAADQVMSAAPGWPGAV